MRGKIAAAMHFSIRSAFGDSAARSGGLRGFLGGGRPGRNYCFGSILLAIALAAGAAPHAQAAEWAYAWANDADAASYAPSANYKYNAGRPVRITRDRKGRYQVRFGRVADPGANVQVTAYGRQRGYCNVASWGGGTVRVACYDPNGQPADRQFAVLAVKGADADSGKLAFAWLQDAERANYTASPQYRFGSGDMAVRRSGQGRYSVALGAPVGSEAAVLATAYGSRANCNVLNWGGGRVNIVCRGRNGRPADSRVSVMAVSKDLPGASFVWNSSNAGQMAPAYSNASDGSRQAVTRLGAGNYKVALGPEAETGGHVQAVAYGSAALCRVERWGGGNAWVRCASGNSPADSRFVIAGFKPAGTSGKPDLVVRSLSATGSPAVNANNSVEVPVRVVVRNRGAAPAGAFKTAAEYTAPHGTFIVALTVPGQSDIWYPHTSSPLAPGSDVAFDGKLTFHSAVHGVTVSLTAIADSCSGDEFMPPHCRVEESNEANNRSSPISLSLP